MKNEAQVRLLVLLQYLYKETDEKHPVSAQNILKHWESRGIKASRKSVYKDITLLADFGIDIVCVKSTQNLYFIGSRLFELPELKLLVNAVESSRFITPKKSRLLIQKLGRLSSSAQAAQLKCPIYMDGMPKPKNEAIYYIVDLLQTAIQENKQISFQYYDSLAGEIAALLDAAHGHALVLFTSYAAMSAVKERLREMELAYPLFTLGRNAVHTTRQFKSKPGGVLLATGAAWEGFDFPGDCVSLLVIPRLPFPIPDALKEKEREQYPTLYSFLRGVVVPEMQIKLKQGFGRAIRLETDTCVVAILDERAARDQRYWKDVLAALPEMPVTQDIHQVEAFIRGVKPDSYFREGAA